MIYRDPDPGGPAPGHVFVDEDQMRRWAHTSFVLSMLDTGHWSLSLDEGTSRFVARVPDLFSTFSTEGRGDTLMEAFDRAGGLEQFTLPIHDSEVPEDAVAWFRRDQEIVAALDEEALNVLSAGSCWMMRFPKGDGSGHFRKAVCEAKGWDFVPFPRHWIASGDEDQRSDTPRGREGFPRRLWNRVKEAWTQMP